MAHADPVILQIGPQKAIFKGFTNFFQNYLIATEVVNINWIPKHVSLEINNKKEENGGALGAKFEPN